MTQSGHAEPNRIQFQKYSASQAGGVRNWHAETNFAVTIAGGSKDLDDG
jgi:hypothetical protein